MNTECMGIFADGAIRNNFRREHIIVKKIKIFLSLFLSLSAFFSRRKKNSAISWSESYLYTGQGVEYYNVLLIPLIPYSVL